MFRLLIFMVVIVFFWGVFLVLVPSGFFFKIFKKNSKGKNKMQVSFYLQALVSESIGSITIYKMAIIIFSMAECLLAGIDL